MQQQTAICLCLLALSACHQAPSETPAPLEAPPGTVTNQPDAVTSGITPGSTGWVLAPFYGQAFNAVTRQEITLTGYATSPNAAVQVLVLDPADQAPLPSSTWTPIANTASDTNAVTVNGTTLYSWSVTATVVDHRGAKGRWPAGGTAHLRALVQGQDSSTFDASLSACIALFPGASWNTISVNCSTHTGDIALVDDENTIPTRDAPFLLFNNDSSNFFERHAGETDAYYRQIDVRGNGVDNLQNFRSTFNMAADGTGLNADSNSELFAIYYNHGDLGFGREMHCKAASDGTERLGCYVTNYGTPGGPSDVGLSLAISRTNPVATVAMEYRPQDNANPITFMVYDGNGNLINAAALDSEGAKPTPVICLTCHGGNYDVSTHTISKTSFLPFDLEALVFSTQAGFTQTDEQDAVRRLNQFVLSTQPTSTIADEINGWYAPLGVNVPGSAVNLNWIPKGWVGDAGTYNNVVKPYCRGCHNALSPPLSWPTSADFDTYKSQIQNDVCTGPINMPASEQTMLHFWSSGARAYMIDHLELGVSCPPLQSP